MVPSQTKPSRSRLARGRFLSRPTDSKHTLLSHSPLTPTSHSDLSLSPLTPTFHSCAAIGRSFVSSARSRGGTRSRRAWTRWRRAPDPALPPRRMRCGQPVRAQVGTAGGAARARSRSSSPLRRMTPRRSRRSWSSDAVVACMQRAVVR